MFGAPGSGPPSWFDRSQQRSAKVPGPFYRALRVVNHAFGWANVVGALVLMPFVAKKGIEHAAQIEQIPGARPAAEFVRDNAPGAQDLYRVIDENVPDVPTTDLLIGVGLVGIGAARAVTRGNRRSNKLTAKAAALSPAAGKVEATMSQSQKFAAGSSVSKIKFELYAHESVKDLEVFIAVPGHGGDPEVFRCQVVSAGIGAHADVEAFHVPGVTPRSLGFEAPGGQPLQVSSPTVFGVGYSTIRGGHEVQEWYTGSEFNVMVIVDNTVVDSVGNSLGH